MECLHKILADVLHVQLACHHEHDDPVSDQLQPAAHGVCAAAHGTTGHTPGQLIHNKDVTLQFHLEAVLHLV